MLDRKKVEELRLIVKIDSLSECARIMGEPRCLDISCRDCYEEHKEKHIDIICKTGIWGCGDKEEIKKLAENKKTCMDSDCWTCRERVNQKISKTFKAAFEDLREKRNAR